MVIKQIKYPLTVSEGAIALAIMLVDYLNSLNEAKKAFVQDGIPYFVLPTPLSTITQLQF